MLSHDSIEHRIQSGEIELHYYFVPGRGGVAEYHSGGLKVDLSKPNAPQTRFFRDKLSSDRLGLTLGPIVKSHNDRLFRRRPQFSTRVGCTDIRESGGVIFLAPHETVSIATNERIVLGPSTFSLILPRITLGDAGILLNVAYIDAFWDGTLQMVLSNSTPYSQRISLLEPIAQCLFFALDEPAPQVFRTQFPLKSHHFGQNWTKVLEGNADPFPLRKVRPPETAGWSRFWERAQNSWVRYRALIGSVGALALIAAGFGGLAEIARPLRDVPAMKEQLDAISPYFSKGSDFNIPALKQSISTLQSKMPSSGLISIEVPTGQRNAEQVITIEKPLSQSSTIWAQQNDPSTGATVFSEVIDTDETQTKIRIGVALNTITTSKEAILVRWVVIP